jgi:hypothetical protein
VKGIIFNLLEEFIIDNWGAARFEKIVARCPIHTQLPYVGPGTYPDANLFAIVEQTTAELGIGTDEALRSFGRFAFPKLAARFPIFMVGHDHPKSFLKTIDGVIHVEVRKLFVNAEPPRITFRDPAPDRLVLHYVSRRNLCPLFAGLIEGTSDYYRVAIAQTQTACTRQSSPECEFSLHFPG